MNRRCTRAAATAACVLTLAIVIASSPARADLRVDFSCHLAADAADCSALRSAYFSTIPGIAAASADQPAEIAVRVGATAVPGGHRYAVDLAEGEHTQIAIEETILASLGADRVLMRVVALLQRGTLPFLGVEAPGSLADGVLRLEARDPDLASRAPTDDATGWYARPKLAGELVEAGLQIVTLRADLELSYSNPEWRLRTVNGASYRSLSAELPGGQRLDGAFTQLRSTTIAARSVGDHTAIAIRTSAERQPQNNIGRRLAAGAGVEWLSSPFVRASESTFGARLALAGVHDVYVTPNVLGAGALLYPEGSATALARFHEGPIDLELEITGSVPWTHLDRWAVDGTVALVYRTDAGLELGTSIEAVVRGGSLAEPADMNALDPVATLVAGSDFGRIGYVAQISLGYTFGNALLRSQDQRWR